MRALILFDLDGTLADSAPDLAAAANQQRHRHGLSPLPYEMLRAVASQGAQGLLGVALDITPDHPEFEAARAQFLTDYAATSRRQTRLFPGIATLLDKIQRHGDTWGIVTNKATHLALPLITSLGLTQCAVIVCGDTLSRAKPYPDPLLYAARQAGYLPSQCLYIGDDLRDIQAAHAAKMPAVAAGYGYLGADQDLTLWQADGYADTPAAIWEAIETLRPRLT
jgi:phosphoglycolate phosphatase